MGDDVEADALELIENGVEEGHILVAHAVEDVHPAKERLMGLAIEQVELELVTHEHHVAHLSGLVQEPLQHVAGSGLDRLARPPAGVTDHLRGVLEPGHDPQRARIRHKLLISVIHLLGHARAAHHVGGGVERDGPAVEVQAVPRISLDTVDRNHLGAARAVDVR